MKLKNKIAVVTGAASGIGRALAIQLAGHGCHLALVDYNQRGLEETLTLLPKSAGKVSTHLADLSERTQVKALPTGILDEHGKVDLLINNAGVALGGNFDQVSEADFDWLMRINFQAVVDLTRSFLPIMLTNQSAAKIINLSSLFGLVAPAGQTAYSASKFAVRGFSNALRHELKESNVSILVVHPGGVATAISDSARVPEDVDPNEVARQRRKMKKFLRMPPEEAASIIIKAIHKDKARVIVGKDAKFISLLERLLPVSYWSILSSLTQR